MRIIGYDLLRSIAILLVLFSHFAASYVGIGGLWGVELFFVLSGFLIGKIIITDLVERQAVNIISLFNFWKRRWFRTLPNYILFLGIFTFLLWVKHGNINTNEWLKYIWFGQNFAWPMGGFFGVSWSLAVEEWFYLTFPFLIWLILKINSKYDRVIISAQVSFYFTVILFIIFPVIFRIYVVNSGPWDIWHRKIALFRLDAMMFGVLAASIHNWFPLIWRALKSNYSIFFAFIFISISSLILWSTKLSTVYTALAFTLLPLGFSLLLAYAENINISSKFISYIIKRLALYSYSIYLLHMVVFEIIETLVNQYEGGLVFKVFERLIGLAIIYWGASMIYKYFEYPLTLMREKFAPEPKKIASIR